MGSYLTPHIKKIHCIGIGGSGMSGIAEILHAQGYIVSGSDCAANAATARLEKKGVSIQYHHHSDRITQVDLVVYSSAISSNNPELQLAKAAHIPILGRGQMLAALMLDKYGIAVGGTHGKTSTVGLIAQLCLYADLDPTLIMGGYLNSIQSHAYAGKNDYFIAEADESDASLLYLKPKIAVLTNIDSDHLATYGGDFDQLVATYKKFLKSVEATAKDSWPMGGIVTCHDDPILRRLHASLQQPGLTYGFHAEAMVRAVDLRQEGQSLYFKIIRESCQASDLEIRAPLSGQHNALNVLAAVSVATLLNIPDELIQAALKNYTGVARRFQLLGQAVLPQGVVHVIDDYGHHPQEIKATAQAIRDTWPNQRLVMIFQPHRYTRTRDLFESFAEVLSEVSGELILLPIYAASEGTIPGVDSHKLLEAIKKRKGIQPLYIEPEHLISHLTHYLRHDDIVLFQGAGDISQLAHRFMKAI
jgi:UDP-N-acetylmuramate--alanine ligase